MQISLADVTSLRLSGTKFYFSWLWEFSSQIGALSFHHVHIELHGWFLPLLPLRSSLNGRYWNVLSPLSLYLSPGISR